MIEEVDPREHPGLLPQPLHALLHELPGVAHGDISAKRRMVLRALEITFESLRQRYAQAITSDAMLDQLIAAIQPDGTLHL